MYYGREDEILRAMFRRGNGSFMATRVGEPKL
jgi:hypothetical protein